MPAVDLGITRIFFYMYVYTDIPEYSRKCVDARHARDVCMYAFTKTY